VHFHSLAQPARDGAEDVAAMKGLTDGLQEIMIRGDVPYRDALLALVNERQHSVIGRYEHVLCGGDEDGPPRRAHAGVDDDQVHSVGREILVGLRDGNGAIEDIERLNGIADVDNLR
jgi:hypothetical protein